MRVLLLLALLPVTAWCQPHIVLVRDSVAQAAVVVPVGASDTVRFAADELAKYLEQISGAKLSVADEGAEVSGMAVHVGPTSEGRAIAPDEAEGFALRAGEGGVVICGGSDRGTLYGVYRFLEEALGCRWLSHDVEYVPTATTVSVRPFELTSAPEFDMRTFVGSSVSTRVWGLKVGMNGFYTAEAATTNGGAYYLPRSVAGCHAYYQIMPPDTYFAEHPEWSPLINGQRMPTSLQSKQLCVTAPGLAEEFAKRVIRVFDEDPALQVMSISPNDGYGWCECDECLALDKKLCGARTTKQGLAMERPFMGDRVFWFANQVARRVAEVHPDKLLLVLAYVNYAEPPDTIVPEPNVIPWLCHYAPADYSRPISDPTSEPNAQFNALLQRWAKLRPDLLIYSYVSKSMWWRLPRPVTATFAADIDHLYSLGIRRYYCQSSLSDWALDGPLYYVIARKLWDPSADADALAADWTNHMFGPAADEMAGYYAAVADSIKESGQSFSDHPISQVPGLFSFADLDRAMAHLDRAAKLADAEPYRERVAKVAAVFQYGYHMIRCLEARAKLEQTYTREALKETVDHGRKALSFIRVREAAEFVDGMKLSDELGVVASGLSKPLELGGRQCWNTDETGVGDGVAGWATLIAPSPATDKPLRIEMDVWGKSELASIVVNTDGENKSYAQGGIWTPVRPQQPLSGKEQWDTLVFHAPPEALAPGKPFQRIGMGGGDSQIWISAVRVGE